MLTALAGCSCNTEPPVTDAVPPDYGAGIEVEIFYPSEEMDGANLQALVREASRKFPAARVSLHDYSRTENFSRMRELENAAGIRDFQRVEAFIVTLDSAPAAIAGEDAIFSDLTATMQALAAANVPSRKEQRLLDTAKTILPQTEALAPLADGHLYRAMRGRKTLGYVADVFVPPDCPTCPPAQFAVVFRPDGAIETIIPFVPIMVKGRKVDAAGFLAQFDGKKDPDHVARDLEPIPDAPDSSRLYLIGVQQAMMDLHDLLAEAPR